MKKKLLALLLGLCLLGSAVPVLAAEETPPLPLWAHSITADGYAMGLFGNELATTHNQPVTQMQLDAITRVVADKLALLKMEQRTSEDRPLVIDTTRGGVLNALYQEAAAYAFPGVEKGPVDFMSSVGAVAGNGQDLYLDRPCTVLEAVTMANSLILSLFDQQNAGSLGLLWKADNGRGNTLYLLGSIHVDRNNVYPFHKQLRDIITSAERVSFELDFNDQAGLKEFSALQVYQDGTTLADHISPELYQAVIQVSSQVGLEEQLIRYYKPWALANMFQSMAMMDESTGANSMAIDLYVNAKAVNAGAKIGAVETYAFQGGLFDSLSDQYQETSLATSILMLLGDDTPNQEVKQVLVDILGADILNSESQKELDNQLAMVGTWMEQWKSRSINDFSKDFDKEAIINGADELSSKLFTGRDPNMIAYADQFLKQPGSHTELLVVGAGHMIGKTGIVQGLKDLGYTVQPVPVP